MHIILTEMTIDGPRKTTKERCYDKLVMAVVSQESHNERHHQELPFKRVVIVKKPFSTAIDSLVNWHVVDGFRPSSPSDVGTNKGQRREERGNSIWTMTAIVVV